VVLVFWIGLYPKPLLDVMHASVERVVASQSVSVIVQQDGVPSDSHPLVMSEILSPALPSLEYEATP
jgi:hypothetical protein